jgi:hypothetical protein
MTFLDPSQIFQVFDSSYDCYECSRQGLLHRDHPITGYAIATSDEYDVVNSKIVSIGINVQIRGLCEKHDHIDSYKTIGNDDQIRSWKDWTCIPKSEYELLQVIQTMLE